MSKSFYSFALPTLFRLTAMIVVSAGVTLPTLALPSDATKPIKLLADKATFNEKTGVTSYSGDVEITQGTLKLTADSLTVNLNKQRSIDTAIATGSPATIEQQVSADKGLAKGRANRLEYNGKTGIVVLIGNAKLNQGGASIEGNKIRYSLQAGDIEATGTSSKRVELIFPPNTDVSRQSLRP